MPSSLAIMAAGLVTALAVAGGCDLLPEEVPTEVPEVPTELPSGLPTEVPEVPTELPSQLPEGVPTEIPDVPTELPTGFPEPPGGDEPAEQEEPGGEGGGEAAPPPEEAEPAAEPTGEPAAEPTGEPAAEPTGEPASAGTDDGGIPLWAWALLVAAAVALVVAAVVVFRGRAADRRREELWQSLAADAVWLDERILPSVVDRLQPPGAVEARWAEGRQRLDDLDRRVSQAIAEPENEPLLPRLDALAQQLARLRDVLDADVALRRGDAPGQDAAVADSAQAVAAARADLRRVVAAAEPVG